MHDNMNDKLTVVLSDLDKRHVIAIREQMVESYPGPFTPRITLSDVVRYALADTATKADART